MSDLNLAESLHKAFLFGVGAVATTAEKSQQVVEDFVEKGELTVEQGKALNKELSRKAKEVLNDSTDEVLRMRMSSMTPEERAAYAAKVAKVAADIDAEPVDVEEEPEDVPADAPEATDAE